MSKPSIEVFHLGTKPSGQSSTSNVKEEREEEGEELRTEQNERTALADLRRN